MAKTSPPTARAIPASSKPPALPAKAKPVAKPVPIKVRATQLGYYDHARRRDGDVFMVDAEHFTPVWMEEVNPRTPERISTAQQSINKQHDEILGGHATKPTGDGNPLGADD